MPSTRQTAGKSNHLDERKSIERNGGIWMNVTRKDRKYMEHNGMAEIAVFISYPSLTGENKLEYEVKHENDEQIYIYTQNELVEDGYLFTLAKLITSTKNSNNNTLLPWIETHTDNITHSLGKGSAVWIKHPSVDTVNDRVAVISGYFNESSYTLDFLQNVIPKYYISHIDHTAPELESETFIISTQLKNGILLINGGRGLASDNDIVCIADSNNNAKYAYLMVQNYCKQQIIEKYKAHIKIIGTEAVAKVARTIKSFLSTKYQDAPKIGYIDIGKELTNKEFNAQIRVATENAPEWKGTKNKAILCIDYNDSIKIFGKKAIVRTFIVKKGTNFILSNTDLKLTHYPNQQRMKIEVFVSHVWM
eukprot:436193_1